MIGRSRIETITDALVSHAQVTGLFSTVNKHEFKSNPVDGGLNCSIFFTRVRPLPRESGLDATSVVMVFTLRIYLNMLSEPQDAIDPAVLAALDAMLDAYTGDFTLDGLIRNVDLLGASGFMLESSSGYIQLGGTGGGMQRIADIVIPMIINDAWTQGA